MNTQQLIAAVMAEVSSLAKTDKNTQQGFNFRGIDAVMNAVGPALRKHAGFIVPCVLSEEHSTVPSKNGGSLNVVRLKVSYEVHAQEGDPIEGVVVSEAFDSGDKATAKAMSVAYRTFLLQLLCLPTDEPDPDSFSYEVAEAVPQPAAPKVDFVLQAWEAKSKAEVTQIYNEARRNKADLEVLEQITAIGKSWAAKEAQA